jgi:hypothetical protein
LLTRSNKFYVVEKVNSKSFKFLNRSMKKFWDNKVK